ncbi:MAG: SCP2 sterol-binding domain-containing protein [Nitrososphaerota archaeon]|nr:SCP2 sterol-binding domain-containing protein [Nitrososphaerota archaeon]MDG6991045.1 SCP2 sterol-binding domain-containing protein [Nitrososphaerota archaeon]
MALFMSDEYVSQVQSALTQDPKWAESSKSFKTSIAFNVTDKGLNYLMNVDNGVTAFQKVPPGTGAEFSFDGTYDSWSKVAKGEVDIQSAVLKGQLKFKGSLTKILMYKDRFIRVAEIMRDVPKEF